MADDRPSLPAIQLPQRPSHVRSLAFFRLAGRIGRESFSDFDGLSAQQRGTAKAARSLPAAIKNRSGQKPADLLARERPTLHVSRLVRAP